jgi:hypothetical protein
MSEALLSAPRGIRANCPASYAAEPRGAREAVGRRRLPRGSESAGDPSAADTVSVDAEDAGIDLTARADSKTALGSRDCGAVELLSTQIVRKQAKAIHLQRRFLFQATSSSTLSNSTNEWVSWQAANFERRLAILELAHPPIRRRGCIHWRFIMGSC